MKAKLALPLLLVGTAFLCREAAAQDEQDQQDQQDQQAEPQQAEPEEEQEEQQPRQKLTPPPPPAKPPAAEKRATLEIYGNLLPFIEYVDAGGPTPEGFMEGPDHIGISVAAYNGAEPAPRARITSGTSHFGIRGSLKLHDLLSVLGQIENAAPIDGDPNPWEVDFPNRNSFLGVGGGWGTLTVGRQDTPYKWTTLTTVNPMPAGYVADYTPVIGTPGFLATALPTVPRYVAGNGVSNAAFYRRDANSIQYWSPTLWGFYGRVAYVTNEWRPSDDPDGGVRSNPYIVSVAAGFDIAGLRLRYAWENHHDYFGLGYINQVLTGAPDENTRTANDYGNKAVAQYTLTINPEIKTRVVGIFEHLKYTIEATIPGDINRYERPALYVLLQQTLFGHNIWGAYGKAFAGECARLPGGPIATCSTAHTGAQLLMAGYLYEFAKNAKAFVMGYRLINDRSGLYVTSPALPREGISPGLDTTGVGVGFNWAFSADLLE
jgi:predicted porin